MEQFIPSDLDVKALHAALALGHPLRLRYQDRDAVVTFIKTEGPVPTAHVTALEPRTGTEYAAAVPLSEATWSQLLAQLPEESPLVRTAYVQFG